jgi:hypothetical protein
VDAIRTRRGSLDVVRGWAAVAWGFSTSVVACTLTVDTDGLSSPATPQSGLHVEVPFGDGGGGGGGDSSSADPDAKGASYVEAVLADGPALYYRLEETSGSAAKDEVGRHPGVYATGTVLGVPGAMPGSLAIALAGTGGIDVGDVLDFEGTKPFTLEAWYFPDTYDTEYRFLFNNNDEEHAAGRQSYALNVHGDDGLTFERYVNGSALFVRRSLPLAGEWSHIVAVYDGATLRLFVNGAVDTTSDLRQARTKNAHLFVGSGEAQKRVLRGRLDEVAIYEKALGSDRIAAHFAAAK